MGIWFFLKFCDQKYQTFWLLQWECEVPHWLTIVLSRFAMTCTRDICTYCLLPVYQLRRTNQVPHQRNSLFHGVRVSSKWMFHHRYRFDSRTFHTWSASEVFHQIFWTKVSPLGFLSHVFDSVSLGSLSSELPQGIWLKIHVRLSTDQRDTHSKLLRVSGRWRLGWLSYF